MKRLCSIFLAFAIMFLSINMPQYLDNTVKAENGVSVWDGKKDTSWYDEEENEFHLNTAQEFAGLATLITSSGITFEGKTIYLENDLNMSNKTLPPYKYFKGTFDGKYHSISNCFSSNQDFISIDKSGLFSELEGTVRNLKLEINSLSFSSIYNGGICGFLNGGTVSNCSVTGKIRTVKDSSDAVIVATGGICGYSISGTIIGCTSSAYISSSTHGSDKSQSYSGGICGICENGTIICNAYFTGTIDNQRYNGNMNNYLVTYTGGIIGKVAGKATISNVYNTGTFVKYASDESNSIKAGVIGICIDAELTGDKIYYLSSTSTLGVYRGEQVAIAKSDANMKKESFVESLGSAFIYKENSYPPLGWEYGYTEPVITTTSTTITTTTSTTTTNTTTTTTTSTTATNTTTTTTTSTTATNTTSTTTTMSTTATNTTSTTTTTTTNTLSSIASTTKATTTTTTTKATTTMINQVLPGDANLDKTIDLSDAVLIMQSLANPDKYGIRGSDKNHITEQGAINADVEGGNGLTVYDALTIQRFLLNLVITLPI